jgi:alanine racemase
MEVYLDNFLNNVNEVKEHICKDKFMYCVVKGNAYGFGDRQIVGMVEKSEADGVAVATLDCALTIRKYYPNIHILVLGIIGPEYYEIASENNIRVCVANQYGVDAIKKSKLTKPLHIHLKINTGMNRIGFRKLEQAQKALNDLKKVANVDIEGIFSHIATAEDDDKLDYTLMQINTFKKFVTELNYPFKLIHISNSATTLKYDQYLDFITAYRPGFIIYGLKEILPAKYSADLNIKSIFKLKSSVVHTEVYEKGAKISYSNNYTTQKDNEFIATIPLGYADGFRRSESSTKILCKNQVGTIVGNVCMDTFMVRFDKPVNIGDEVTIIGNDEFTNIFKKAESAQTIPQELLVQFGMRVPRKYYINNELVDLQNDLLHK